MGSASLVAAASAAVLLAFACVLVVVARERRRSRRQLDAALLETAELRLRLDQLSEQLARTSAEMVRTDDPAYVITDAGAATPSVTVSDGVVLSAAVGEPLVKVVAFAHGMRRALSAESRNKIWFEMRREVRRTRKQRRREMKEAWRRMQAEERAA